MSSLPKKYSKVSQKAPVLFQLKQAQFKAYKKAVVFEKSCDILRVRNARVWSLALKKKSRRRGGGPKDILCDKRASKQ